MTGGNRRKLTNLQPALYGNACFRKPALSGMACFRKSALDGNAICRWKRHRLTNLQPILENLQIKSQRQGSQ